MDGDVAPLAELAHLAEKFAAMLMVDEAHATGVLGERGRGACEAAGICSSAALVRTGTLSKALGSLGGFVVGSKRLIRWLVNRSRPYIFSTAAPAAICSAALRALEIVATEPQRRKSLQVKSADLRSQFRAAGWQVGASQSQIIPVILGEPQKTMKFAAELKRRGLFVPGIRPPSVPVGESLLRISLTANHTPQMCDRLILSMNEIRQPSPSH
jgi:8-amino-7-oxononanoate synthase